LSLLLLAGAAPARPAAAMTYADAQNDLGWLSVDAAAYRKNLANSIRKQTANLEVRNRLEQTKIKVEEMIQRDNFAKACKVIEVGFTVATVGAGGIAAATTQGLSVISKEGLAIAGKYMAEKGAVELGKEAAGVPGYSDSVKAGVFVFNKFDENELRGQLSRDNIGVLLKAKQLLEDDTDGRTLQSKLPELRQMLLDLQSEMDQTAVDIKASDKLIAETLEKARKLSAEAVKLKEEEKKAADKASEEAKKSQPAGLVNTEVSKPANVPPAQIGPQDTPEQKRRKMQEAIDKYINSLSAAIAARKKAVEETWLAVTKPANKNNTRYFVSDEIQDLYAGLAYNEERLTGPRTYHNMEGIETSARTTAGNIAAFRTGLEAQKSDIKSRIEPLITELSGYAAQWRSAYNIYTPQGYHVPEPDNIRNSTAWISYYELPLKYADGYLKGTDGLEAKFKALEANARAQKDAIYAETMQFLGAYAAKLQAYKDYKPQVTGQLEKISAAAAKPNAILNALPNDFVTEFSYDGKYDLADLEAKVAAARPAFAEAQKLYAGGSALYQDLLNRHAELTQMSEDPLWSEGMNIFAMSENKAHKAEMSAALKKLEAYSRDMTGTEGWQAPLSSGSDLMFGAEEALKYLKAQSGKLAGAYASAASDFKANTSKDLSYLGALPPEKYGAEIQRIFAPVQRAEEEKAKIIDEVRKQPFFGGARLLEKTGFWTVQAGAKRDELEKASAAFWDSPKGKEISDARRGAEVLAAADKRDPGLAAVRKMYEDFEKAYEARSAGRVMSFISEDWTAGDGTAAADLNEQFSRIFRLFDEINVEITNLQVSGEGGGRYTASYNMKIRSRIYSKNIKHEESSSVYEHVAVAGGTAKITKTEAGGYWEVK
jgi:ketosteroid isomerase-like protein